MGSRKPHPFEDPEGGFELRLLMALGLWIAVHLLATWAGRPPRALGADDSPRAFSAGRAMEIVERLSEGLGPHPAGTQAADTVRERVLAELRRVGYQPLVQEVFACGPYFSCGTVRNVVARLKGRQKGPATLLTAHYDSVAAGSGVADDLAGVAALIEIARVLELDGRLERTVLFLLSDAEEFGLVGASAFAQSHPRMEEVGAVLNVEARGVSGPSRMFETGPDNAWLIELYAEHVAHPAASSLAAELYRRMPNDTDFRVFRERGVQGLNFAIIEGWHAYHTPLDDVERLDARSLQHHGDNLLAMVYALDGARQPQELEGDAVYTDLFGAFVLRLRAGWCLPLAMLAALAVCWGMQRAVRHGSLTWGRATWGICAWPLLVVAPIAVGSLFVTLLDLATGARTPHAHGAATLLALVGACLVAHAALVPILARRARPSGLAHGGWVAWALLGMFLALFLPGASYLFFIPAMLLGAATLGMRLRGDVDARIGRVGMCAVVVAAALWSPVQNGVGTAFGVGMSPGIIFPVSVLATLLAPLVACANRRLQRNLVSAGSLLLLLGLALGLLLPQRGVERPAHLNLAYDLDVVEGEARWEVQSQSARVPATLAALLELEPGEEGALVAEAPVLDIPPPSFEVLEDRELDNGERLVRGVLRSPAFAAATEVEVIGARPPRSLRAEGVETSSAAEEFQPSATFIGVSPEGIELAIVFGERTSGDAEVEGGPSGLRIVDTIWGLPLEGDELTDARPRSFVPRGDGDVTRIRTRVLFDPEPEQEAPAEPGESED